MEAVTHGLAFPLFGAVHSRDVEMARLLISRGANVNAKAKNGESALRLAQQQGSRELVELLIAHGAKNES